MIGVIVLALFAAVSAVILKQYDREFALFVSLSAGIMILMFSLNSLNEITDFINKISGGSDLAADCVKILLKVLGIAYLAEFCCNICRDVGETAVSVKVEVAAKIVITLVSLPLFEKLYGIIVASL